MIPNIRSASITDTKALVKVEIEGDVEAIDQAVAYMKERGVKVEELGADDDRALD